MTRTIIIEDEPQAADVLCAMVREHFPDLNIVAVAGTVQDGIRAIEQHHPDLVLSDIQLGAASAFEIFQSLSRIDFDVIFVSAYEQFAIKAFRIAAIDYLLKPFALPDLQAAIDKFRKKQQGWQSAQQFDTLFHNLKQLQKGSKKIALPTMNGLEVINMNEIIRCQSQVNYTYFYLTNNRRYVIARTLKEYEELLQAYDFVRAHQSHLVNLHHIKTYIKGEGGTVVMSDGSAIEVSRRKKDELIRRISTLH